MAAHAEWCAECERIAVRDSIASEEYEEARNQWKSEREHYFEAQRRANESVDSLARDYLEKEPRAVLQALIDPLKKLQLLPWLDGSLQMRIEPDLSLLIVDYRLPTIDQLFSLDKIGPNLQLSLKKREREELYDASVHQFWLSVVHTIFKTDSVMAIRAIIFNGIIDAVDPATGNDFSACILSVRVERADFAKLNLSAVDPAACFKFFKGIGATKLHAVVPVQPIVSLKRDDDRFVAGRDVTSGLNSGVNLAAMGWEEFEHLIRQLFEQEFAKNGGEVRVTKASRDGGVDAVIFDPDPIHGGKIVVQAKRYTNTVGVAAVRELYGTVVNEGASKGILVTTSSFGPDAHAFAANKPLTLLDGQNLLYLLGKHGHQAHIDLANAKALGVALNRYSATTGGDTDDV
jgi:restriction system protein